MTTLVVPDKYPLARWIGRRVLNIGQEISLVVIVFEAWQFCVYHTRNHATPAFAHGYLIWHAEQFMHIDIEKDVQSWSHWAIPYLNIYYMTAHFSMLLAAMIGLAFTKGYPRFRNTMLLATFTSFAVALWETAPLKFLNIGIVDTNPHDPLYSASTMHGMVDVYSAFPSVHVCWAFIISLAFWQYAPKPLRWISLHYPLTVWCVIATGNHSVIDCAAGTLIGLAAWMIAGRIKQWLPLPPFLKQQRA